MTSEAQNLAACRIFTFGFGLLAFGGTDFTAWASVPDAFYQPIALFRYLGFPAPQYGWLLAAQWIWRVSAILACVGLYTRFAAPLAALSALYLLPMTNNFGQVARARAAFAVALLILGLSRCGDAWSLDALRRRGSGVTDAPWQFEYRWPIVAVQTLVAISLFAAGIAKLRHSGLAWITTDNLALLIGQHSRVVGDAGFPALALWLADQPRLCSLIAGFTVAIEITNPVALFCKPSRWVLAPAAVMMLLGFWVFLGPVFFPLMILNVYWVEWPAAIGWLRRKRAA